MGYTNTFPYKHVILLLLSLDIVINVKHYIQCYRHKLHYHRDTHDSELTHVSRIYGQLHKELYLDEKTMPHVYVIVSRIWARWEKSIGNKILEKILSIRTNLLFGPSLDQFPCSRASGICPITTYFYLTRSCAVWVCTLESQEP